MKKIMFLCLIMPTFMVYGQRYKVPMNLPNYDKQKLHFGFLIGLNILDFKIMQNTQQEEQLFVIKSQDQKGFNLGIVSNYHLGRRFDLRAISTLSLAERRIQYVFRQQEDVLEDYQFVEVNKKIESTFIELPILIKYKSDRYNNGRAYLITGLKYALDLASQKNIDDENQQIVKIKNHDFSYELGLGFDFYFPYFKFSPELKAHFGVSNLKADDDSVFSQSIKSLKTRGITISFSFE